MSTTKSNKTESLQRGTGLHVDINGYDMWKKELQDGTKTELDRFRLFQSYLACSDNSATLKGKDGGMSLVPGFHLICAQFYKKTLPKLGGRRNLKVWGSYITKFNKDTDAWIFDKIQPIGRIPSDWQIPKDLLPTVNNGTSMQQLQQICGDIAAEHAKLTFDPIQAGDFVFWDIRMAHQNADSNDTDKIRHVIYHAFLLANEQVNGKLVKDVQYCRNNCKHLIPDFPKVYANLESQQATKDSLPKLTQLGKQMYNMSPYMDPVPQFTPEEDQGVKIGMSKVTDRHIAFYKRYGYVVIENAMPKEFIQQCKVGMTEFFKKKGVPLDLTKDGIQPVTLEQWEKVGQRFGGMVESFWTPEHEQVRLSPVLYGIYVALGGATWAKNEGYWQSPYGKFSPYHLWLYSDRQNVRFPSSWGQLAKQDK